MASLFAFPARWNTGTSPHTIEVNNAVSKRFTPTDRDIHLFRTNGTETTEGLSDPAHIMDLSAWLDTQGIARPAPLYIDRRHSFVLRFKSVEDAEAVRQRWPLRDHLPDPIPAKTRSSYRQIGRR